MIIGSIVGYETAMGVATAVTAIGGLINSMRSHNGEVVAPSHVDVPVVDYTGSAFLDPLNIHEQETAI
jgi:hypothetical protein